MRKRTITRRRGGLYIVVIAYGIRAVGDAAATVAIPWFAFQTSGSVGVGTVVIALGGLGSAISAFLIGPLVDRFGLRRSAVLANLAGGATLAALPMLHAAGWLSQWSLMALVLAIGALDVPAEVALQGIVVPIAGAAGIPLERVNSQLQAIGGAIQALGPAIGGVAIAVAGTAQVLLINTATCICAAVVVSLVPVALLATRAVRPRQHDGYLTQLRGGWQALRRTPLLRDLTVVRVLRSALGNLMVGVVLAYAAQLHSAEQLGAMSSALGIGLFAGAALFATRGHRLPRRAVFLACSASATVLTVFLALRPELPPTLAVLVGYGVLTAPAEIVVASVFQERIPPEVFGRVMITVRAATGLAAPLGLAMAGTAVDALGMPATVIVVVALDVGVLAIAALSRPLRDINSRGRTPVEPAYSGGKP